MKHHYRKCFCKIIFASLIVLPFTNFAQVEKISYMRPSYWRPYNKTGINIFETTKDADPVPFNGLRIRFGAGLTQQYQNLKEENPGALNNDAGSYANYVSTPGNKLKPITPGFQTAQANLFMDVQLADGIRLNVTSYLSSKHHNSTWVKGGYIQFDKLPFKGSFWTNIMKVTTIKIGHFEVDYGDEHFRRSDGGQALYNPFMEGNIMDEFATEIGGEVFVQKNGFFGMASITSGMSEGNVDSMDESYNTDGDFHKDPSIILKTGFDKKLNDDLRVRLSASYYGNQSCGSNEFSNLYLGGGNTLMSGDRAGSNYQFVMEQNSINPNNATDIGTPLAFSGRFNPGFGKKINAFMFNGFLKTGGLEFFSTYETASGRTAKETVARTANQFAVDGVYRFGKEENLFIGARYNTVSAKLANSAKGTGAGAITYNDDVTVNRVAFAAGWFITRNLLLKAEYVDQRYKDFPAADYRSGGRFHGYVMEAVVGF
jgi:hypothetical protein